MSLATQQIQIDKLGDLLRQARQSFGYSFKEISQKTKIAEKYLVALENGDYQQLPSPTYTRGFLENYASFLGINAEELVQAYKKESSFFELKQRVINQNGRKKISLLLKNKKDSTALLKSPSRLHLLQPQRIKNSSLEKVIGIILIIGLIGYFGWVVSRALLPPSIKIISPANNLETVEKSIIIKGSIEPGAIVKINDQTVTRLEKNIFEEQVSLLPGLNSIKISAKKKNSAETIIWRQIFVK